MFQHGEQDINASTKGRFLQSIIFTALCRWSVFMDTPSLRYSRSASWMTLTCQKRLTEQRKISSQWIFLKTWRGALNGVPYFAFNTCEHSIMWTCKHQYKWTIYCKCYRLQLSQAKWRFSDHRQWVAHIPDSLRFGKYVVSWPFHTQSFQVLEKWPLDSAKKGKDLGEALRFESTSSICVFQQCQIKRLKNIARGTTDPGYWLFNLSYLSS